MTNEQNKSFLIQGNPDNLDIPLYIGEEMGTYQTIYYCVNCGEDLHYEHQERCEYCNQKQLWEQN